MSFTLELSPLHLLSTKKVMVSSVSCIVVSGHDRDKTVAPGDITAASKGQKAKNRRKSKS